jgi:hypothetical protein
MARRGAKRQLTTATGVNALKINVESVKFTGYEPEWVDVEIPEKDRQRILITTFNWYNYHFASKEAVEMIVDYLIRHDRKQDAKLFKKVGANRLPNAIAWLCRMSLVGWKLTEDEQTSINHAISTAIEVHQNTKQEEEPEQEEVKDNKPTIQERMLEKAMLLAGDFEGLLDEYIADGVKAKHKYSPINMFKSANTLPHHASVIVEAWEKHKAEFTEAYDGKCKDLKEAYSHFTKIQLRNLIKFAELIIADANSYVVFKKATKAPRKRKQKTPQQLVMKLKYLKEFPELKLKSEKPTKIIEAKEMFVYSTKKRKLQYYIADEHAGNMLTVKNNTIVGFDKTKSVQKTIRKPAEQISEFMKASKPNSRKIFKDIKTVDTKLTGRFAEDLVILKVW